MFERPAPALLAQPRNQLAVRPLAGEQPSPARLHQWLPLCLQRLISSINTECAPQTVVGVSRNFTPRRLASGYGKPTRSSKAMKLAL
jgi:hypothetical protein